MGSYFNEPLRKLKELLYRYLGLGVRSVAPVGDFLEINHYKHPYEKNRIQWKVSTRFCFVAQVLNF